LAQYFRIRQSPTSACFIPLQALASIIICKDTVFYTPPHPFGTDFKPLIKWQERLHQPNFDNDSFNIHKADYIKNSYYHYQYFFKKDSLLKARHIDHLLIIPVRSGAGFPFELLLCSPADSLAPYADLDYLLRHYTIQYIPSLSLWQQARDIATKTTNNGKILAYAPSYEKDQINPDRQGKTGSLRRALSPLKGAKEEVKNLQNIYYGDYRFAVDANEAAFKQQIKEGYAIIHLAMHGLFDDKSPEHSSLAFSETPDTTEDNFFHTYEIAQSRTNAQLVVLSACETAVGQQQAGEGTMSIARYFIYAGVPAIIATRWQVNDQTTAIIMQQFYQNLYDGIPVHKAMQQAQLLYLQHAKGTAQHPFFWSPYINIGYTDRYISIANKNWATKYYIGAPVALFLLLIGFYFYRRKKNMKYEV
jgi:CHAT domain-containing protein